MVNTRHFLSFYVRFGWQLKDIQNTPDLPLKYSLHKLWSPVCVCGGGGVGGSKL